MAEVRKPRIINTSRILRGLWVNRRISRIQLARDLGLNKSTISSIVGELIGLGIINELSQGASGPLGGRKPVQLELNRKYGYVIGLEIRPESYTAVAIDLAGDILFSRTESGSFFGENCTASVKSLLHSLSEELNWIGFPILGMGIGMSGIINSLEGILLGSIPLRLKGTCSFVKEIESDFSFPIYIENDANCCAWGELVFHRTKKLRNFIFTLVEFHSYTRNTHTQKEIFDNTSVGFGMVFDGKVYYGNQHSAGEFQSVFRNPGDRGQFRVSNTEDRIDEKPEKLKELIEELSKHLALFINTFNLGQIFLGGDIERYQDVVIPILKKAIDDNWVYDYPGECEIRFSSLGDKSVAYGSAGMVLERIFINPRDWNRSKVLSSLLITHEKKAPSGA